MIIICPVCDLALLLSDSDFDDPLDDLLDELDPPKAPKPSSLSEKASGKKSDSPSASPHISQKKNETGNFCQMLVIIRLFHSCIIHVSNVILFSSA